MQTAISPIHLDNGSDARWYAVRVRSRHEKAVATSMESKGLQTFLPLYSATRNGSGRKKQSLLPLLPGYLFCRFDAVSRRDVLLTPGVVGVIAIGNQPEPFPDSEISAIRTLVLAGTKPWISSTGGDWFKINGGPLDNLSGRLIHSEDRDHIAIELCGLEQSMAVNTTALSGGE